MRFQKLFKHRKVNPNSSKEMNGQNMFTVISTTFWKGKLKNILAILQEEQLLQKDFLKKNVEELTKKASIWKRNW